MRKLIMIIMGVALMALPIMAQQQEWKSTSVMQGAGSTYSPQVTAVGAAEATGMATTTESNSPARVSGPRKNNYNDLFDQGADTGKSSESPIGDAVLPLLFLSLAFCGVIYLRRRKALSR